MKRIFIISDMHLGHEELSADGLRPIGFSEKIISNLGKLLNPSDLLIDLGDVCWKDYDLWFLRLGFISCKRWLVRGNHDKKSVSYYVDHGYDMVCDGFRLEMFGKKIFFSHMPVKEDGWYDLNIHGHFHDFGTDRVREVEPELYNILTPKHKLISLEESHYQAIKLQTLVEG